MAKSTGIILAAGGIAYGNDVILNRQPPGNAVRVIIGTGIAAAILAGAEHISEPLAVGVAWIALITTILIPRKGGKSVAENLISFTGIGL